MFNALQYSFFCLVSQHQYRFALINFSAQIPVSLIFQKALPIAFAEFPRSFPKSY